MVPADRPRRLRVGSLEATWDRGGLRWITYDDTEILRGILLTARDADWRTLQAAIGGLHISADTDTFSIEYDAHWRGQRFGVDGQVTFKGGSDWIEAGVTARVATETVAQRLGLVVLHPSAVSGRPFEVTQDNAARRGEFPVMVVPDRVATEVRSLSWQPADGLEAALLFQGEPWEIEDQRAWTDASFKGYSPPLSRPHPVKNRAGVVVETRIRLDVTGSETQPGRATNRRRLLPPRVTIRDETLGSTPPIGVAWSGPLSIDEATHLRVLGPAHLRVVVDRLDHDWRTNMAGASRDAAAVGALLQLELVAFADKDARRELVDAAAAIDVPLAGALAFGTADDAGLVTSVGSEVNALRDRLQVIAPGIELGGGSRVGYAELAGGAIPFQALDSVAFSVTPQIHATDQATILENLTTLPVLMQSGAVLGGGRPLDVVCSFRPRFDGYTDPPERRPGGARFDDRLAGPLGSAWMVGALAGVLTGRTGRVTILEASGPASVLVSDGLGGILGAVLSMVGAQVLRVETTGRCTAVALRSGDRLLLIVANLHDRARTVQLTLPAGWFAPADVTDRIALAPLGHRVVHATRGILVPDRSS